MSTLCGLRKWDFGGFTNFQHFGFNNHRARVEGCYGKYKKLIDTIIYAMVHVNMRKARLSHDWKGSTWFSANNH